MKQGLLKSLCLASVLSLSACSKDGGGDNKAAQVPTGPQGQVFAQGDQNTYCNLTGSGLVCTSRLYQTGPACTPTLTPVINYTDTNSLCQQIINVQSTDQNCNVSQAILAVRNQYCSNIPVNQNGGAGLVSNDPNMRVVQCDFEAHRYQESKGFFRINRSVNIPKLTAQIQFDSRRPMSFDLRNYFIFDIGHFGQTKMIYTPSGIKGTADTLTLSNSGLNKMISSSQSGFAGQKVSLDVMSDDGNMQLNVSCGEPIAGQVQQFRKNVKLRTYSKYRCHGTSRLVREKEDVDVSLPYNSNLMNSEINLAEGLTAVVTGDIGGVDNARITFTTSGISPSVSLSTSAYLKTSSKLTASDGIMSVDLTCAPE